MNVGGIYIGLGSNLGDRAEHIRSALRELAEEGDIRVIGCSTLHETEPVGGPPGQGPYLNAVAELSTDLPPRPLLTRMLAIESRHGRVRAVRNGARTLDLDLLVYRDRVIDEPGLNVPHPRMWDRSFVMEPLREVCPAAQLEAYRGLRPSARTPNQDPPAARGIGKGEREIPRSTTLPQPLPAREGSSVGRAES